MKKTIKTVLKLALVLLCIWLVARRVDAGRVRAVFRDIDWRFIGAAALTVWMEPIIAAVKWRGLMAVRRESDSPPLGLVVRVVFTANFLIMIAPTALGADALRIWMLRQRSYRVAHTVGAMLTDRVLGLATLLALTVFGWLLARDHLPSGGHDPIPWLALGGLALLAIAFLPVWQPLLRRCRPESWLARLAGPLPARLRTPLVEGVRRLRQTVEHTFVQFQEYRRYPAAMGRAGAWNLAIQFLRMLQVFFLFRALHHPVPLFHVLAFVPLIVILSMLPVSFYGAGIKETAFVFLFARIGVPEEVSLSVSLLTYPLIVSALLPGLLFFLSNRSNNQEPPGAPAPC